MQMNPQLNSLLLCQLPMDSFLDQRVAAVGASLAGELGCNAVLCPFSLCPSPLAFTCLHHSLVSPGLLISPKTSCSGAKGLEVQTEGEVEPGDPLAEGLSSPVPAQSKLCSPYCCGQV